jgi:uncharacterized membrane protein YfhO
VDGRPATLHVANLGFRAVAISPGTHIVRFSYDPPGFLWGFTLTVVALSTLGALWRRSRPVVTPLPEPPPAAEAAP